MASPLSGMRQDTLPCRGLGQAQNYRTRTIGPIRHSQRNVWSCSGHVAGTMPSDGERRKPASTPEPARTTTPMANVSGAGSSMSQRVPPHEASSAGAEVFSDTFLVGKRTRDDEIADMRLGKELAGEKGLRRRFLNEEFSGRIREASSRAK